MTGPEELYDEVSSLRRMCSEGKQKLDKCGRKLTEVKEAADDIVAHLESANPCLWVEDSDLNSAAEWTGERDILVDHFKGLLQSIK